ncbi:MAG: SLC13 family permease [Polyangiaceae bacterium]
MNLIGIVVFALTYVLISLRRLSWLGFDRPAGALLGATLCVVFRVLTPEAATRAVDGNTLLLLFGVMGMGAFLAVDGFFDSMETACVMLARTRALLLAYIVWGAGVLSALITNDAVCVLGAPLVVRLIKKQNLPPSAVLARTRDGRKHWKRRDSRREPAKHAVRDPRRTQLS